MENPNGRDTVVRSSVAAISAGIVISGDVECAADLQIAGRVQGDVRCPTVFVDEGGSVAGGIYAERVRVSGSVDGTIEAGDLAIEPGGKVSGTVTYQRLKVTAGGIAEGNFKHRGDEPPVAEEPDKRRMFDDTTPSTRRSIYVD